jgi:hypothetical protein
MGEEREPIDTSTPWHRPRREPLTQVEYERLAYKAMSEPGHGKIHKMSLVTPTYEPNRAIAPDPDSIISKKGVTDRTPDSFTTGDRAIHFAVGVCLLGIAGVILYTLIKLG